MTFDEYVVRCKSFAKYAPEYAYWHNKNGLSGEAGEVRNLLAKQIRKLGYDPAYPMPYEHPLFGDSEFLARMDDELGDVLHYLCVIASDLKSPLDINKERYPVDFTYSAGVGLCNAAEQAEREYSKCFFFGEQREFPAYRVLDCIRMLTKTSIEALAIKNIEKLERRYGERT